MSDDSSCCIRAKIYYGIATPRSFGSAGPREVVLDPNTGFIELVDCVGDPMLLYKAFAGKPVTLRGIHDRTIKFTGFLGCKETKENALYIKDLFRVPPLETQ